MLSRTLEETQGIGSNRNVAFLSVIRDFNLDVVFAVSLKIAVEQRFIQVNQQYLFTQVLRILR
jgi:hypothetical protein